MKKYNIVLTSSPALATERQVVADAILDFPALYPGHQAKFEVVRSATFSAFLKDEELFIKSDVFLIMHSNDIELSAIKEFNLALKRSSDHQKPHLLILKKEDGRSPGEKPEDEITFQRIFAGEQELRSAIFEELQKLGKQQAASGLKDAKGIYQEQLSRCREISENNPDNLEYKNALAVAHEHLGEIFESSGDLKNALEHYHKRNDLGEEVAAKSPENLHYKNVLAISFAKLGDLYKLSGDLKKALGYYQERNKLGKEIAVSSPDNAEFKHGLAISHAKLGEVYELTGAWKKALSHYQKRNKISHKVYESRPENLDFKNSLAISHEKLGSIYEQTGEWQKALDHYRERNKLGREIHEKRPENLEYKNGFAVSHSKLGGIYELMGEWGEALSHYQQRNNIGKDVHESSPENLEYKNGLAVSFAKLGGIYELRGDWSNAHYSYREQLRLYEEMAELNPENPTYQNGIAISLSRLGAGYLKQNEIADALGYLSKSRPIFEVLWRSTQGRVVSYAYHYALNTYDLTRIIKFLIGRKHYPEDQIEGTKAEIKKMRREGLAVLKSLVEKGILHDNQTWLYQELSDETWYDF